MGTPHRLTTGFLSGERGVEGGARFEHGAGDGKEAVGDRSQGLDRGCDLGFEGRVFRSASEVVLNGEARPRVHGVGQSVMAGLSSDNDAALAGALGDRRDSCQAA